jgi:hypothetical protein
MNQQEINAHLARALGREIDGPAERRLAGIFLGVVLAAERVGEQSLVDCCAMLAAEMAGGRLPACPILRPRPSGG